MYSKSIDKITLAKALGICLVVIGHSGCPSTMKNIIYLFHMPFFFFISGYCFKDKYLTDFRTFFKHLIKGLYFLFIKYTLIFILLHNLLFSIDIYNTEYGTGNGKIIYELSEFPHFNTWWGLYSFVGITIPLSIYYLFENCSFKK